MLVPGDLLVLRWLTLDGQLGADVPHHLREGAIILVLPSGNGTGAGNQFDVTESAMKIENWKSWRSSTLLEKAYIRFREDLPDNPNTCTTDNGFIQTDVQVTSFHDLGDVCAALKSVWRASTRRA